MKTFTEINVVGTQYRPPETIDTLKEIAGTMVAPYVNKEGEIPARFVREYSNKHDPNAVQVFIKYKKGLWFVGYVPAVLAPEFWKFYRTTTKFNWHATVWIGQFGQPIVKAALTKQATTPTTPP